MSVYLTRVSEEWRHINTTWRVSYYLWGFGDNGVGGNNPGIELSKKVTRDEKDTHVIATMDDIPKERRNAENI